MLTNERQQKVIALCQELIRQKGYSGHEDGVVRALEAEMKQAGFDSVTVDTYGNIIGCIKGNRPGPKLLFDGHIDTVPVSDEKEWKYPPFAAEIHDGKIYGRGTSDMKGAVSAFVSAAENFAQDTNRDFAGEIYVAGVVHEECFEGVAARAISAAVKPDYVVIAEASKTIYEFIKETRILYASHLLMTTNVPISEIGYRVGYESASYFTKTFREVFGVSPQEYRKNSREA